ADQAARAPETEQPPGCPRFGPDSVRSRPDNAQLAGAPVAPGLHRAEIGGGPVVWWDSTLLRLDVLESVGLVPRKILAADAGGGHAAEAARAHDAWQEPRARTRAAAAAPSLRVSSATEHAARELEAGAAAPAEVALESVAIDGFRPRGRRFGTLVHAILSL